MSIEVNSVEELKAAIDSGETEITSYDDEVVKKLKAVKLAKSWGPAAVAAIIAAIPLVISTGPVGVAATSAAISAAAPSTGVATSTIVALVVAIGGVIAISLFTDWEYVELPGGIKMKRKSKS